MPKKLTQLLITFNVCLFMLFSCGGDSPKAGGNRPASSSQNPLLIPGSLITLPATDGQTVQGRVIDSNKDKVGDGLDLDGDGSREFIYVDDTDAKPASAIERKNGLPANKNHVSGHHNDIAFYIAGNPGTIYYLVSVSGQFAIFSDGGGSGTEILLVVSDGAIQGLDIDGDGFPDDTTLEGVVPVYIGLPDYIVISEVGNSVYSSIYNDYIELYNPTDK